MALAGDFGTLEELSEMIVQKQLGYNQKPIVILNTSGFYDKLIEFFDEIISQKFAKNTSRELYFVAKTPQEAVEYLINYEPKVWRLQKLIFIHDKKELFNSSFFLLIF